jgi:hypothetical protein
MTELARHPIVAFATSKLGWTPSPRQADLLDDVADESVRIAIAVCGRRSGKNIAASTIASYHATVMAERHRAAVLPEELVEIVVISRSQGLARRTHHVIGGFLRRLARDPANGVRIIRETADEIELAGNPERPGESGILIRTAPCHAAGVRGAPVAVLVADEMAWWVGRDQSPLDPT